MDINYFLVYAYEFYKEEIILINSDNTKFSVIVSLLLIIGNKCPS